MNISDIKRNIEDNKEKEKNKIKEENKVDLLEIAILKSKAESGVRDLELKIKTITQLLNEFTNKIPLMINNLDELNQNLETKQLNEVLENIKLNSNTIIKYSNSILLENKRIVDTFKEAENFFEKKMDEVSLTAVNKIESLSNEISKEVNQRIKRNQKIDNLVCIILLLFIFSGIGFKIYYEKKLIKQSNEIYKIHQILSNEKKYWFDDKNRQLYIDYKKEKNKNLSKRY